MKGFFTVLAVLLTLLMAFPALGEGAPYYNPVFDESFADPCAIRGEDGYIYAYGTPDEWSDGSFNLCPILRSKNLVEWEHIGNVFETIPDWNYSEAIWATEIKKIGDKYLFYYTLIDDYEFNPSIGVAVADHPAGPFTDHGKVVDTAFMSGVFIIDPFVFYDEEGNLYMTCGNYDQGSFYLPLTADGLSLLNTEKANRLSPGFEGVYIIQREGMYYLFGSLGTVWEGAESTYHVCVARSEDILGPYVNKAGELLTEANKDDGTTVILKPGTGDRFIGGPGNNAIIQDDNGVYWMVYHGVDSDKPYMNNGGTRRPLCIDPIYWDDEGWPYMKDGVPSLAGELAPVFTNEAQ